MAERHEIMDLGAIRAAAPAAKPNPVELAKARLQGKSFSQLSQSEKDDLLMIVGCQMGIIVPETSEH